MGLVAVLLGTAMFMLPAIVAYCRRHPRRELILILNLCLGATGIGWLILLFWANSEIKNKNKNSSVLALEEPKDRIGSAKSFLMNAIQTGLTRTGLKHQLRPPPMTLNLALSPMWTRQGASLKELTIALAIMSGAVAFLAIFHCNGFSNGGLAH